MTSRCHSVDNVSTPKEENKSLKELVASLKAHGLQLIFPSGMLSDSDSDSKSDLDDDYYRHLPAPISDEQLLGNSVPAKSSSNIEKEEVGGTSLYSSTLKENLAKENATQQKVTMKKNKLQMIPIRGVSEAVSFEEETVSVTTERSQPETGTEQQKQIQEEIIKIESEKLSELIKQEIRREFDKLKLEHGLVKKENAPPSLLKKSTTQTLPLISQAVQQNTAKINKKKKQEETQLPKYVQQNVPHCRVEVSKIEKIFNYVDSADKCLQAIIKKTSTNDQHQNVNNHDKLHYVLQHIQYAHRDLKSIRHSIQQKHKNGTMSLTDVLVCLKAHGQPSTFPSDSDSDGKSELDADYYQHLPPPISDEHLLANSVTAKSSSCMEKEEIGGTSLHSLMVKENPSKKNASQQKVTKKKKEKQKIPNPDNPLKNGASDAVSLDRKTHLLSVTKEKSQPQNGTEQQRDLKTRSIYLGSSSNLRSDGKSDVDPDCYPHYSAPISDEHLFALSVIAKSSWNIEKEGGTSLHSPMVNDNTAIKNATQQKVSKKRKKKKTIPNPDNAPQSGVSDAVSLEQETVSVTKEKSQVQNGTEHQRDLIADLKADCIYLESLSGSKADGKSDVDNNYYQHYPAPISDEHLFALSVIVKSSWNIPKKVGGTSSHSPTVKENPSIENVTQQKVTKKKNKKKKIPNLDDAPQSEVNDAVSLEQETVSVTKEQSEPCNSTAQQRDLIGDLKASGIYLGSVLDSKSESKSDVDADYSQHYPAPISEEQLFALSVIAKSSWDIEKKGGTSSHSLVVKENPAKKNATQQKVSKKKNEKQKIPNPDNASQSGVSNAVSLEQETVSVTKEGSQPQNGTEQQRDLMVDLKARGIYLGSPLDSKSDSKSDVDADYYQYYPVPISEEQLFALSVIAKSSWNIEKKVIKVGGTSSHSPTVKENPAIENVAQQKVTKKKNKKKKILNLDDAPQSGVNNPVSLEQETVSVTKEQSQPCNGTEQQRELIGDLKARGIYLGPLLDSKSDSKSDVDADYYQHYPAPISEEQLFALSVIAKSSWNIEKKVGGTSSRSLVVKKNPTKENAIQQKVSKKNNEKQKIPNPDNAPQSGVSDAVSLEQETVSVTKEKTLPQNSTKQQRDLIADLNARSIYLGSPSDSKSYDKSDVALDYYQHYPALISDEHLFALSVIAKSSWNIEKKVIKVGGISSHSLTVKENPAIENVTQQKVTKKKNKKKKIPNADNAPQTEVSDAVSLEQQAVSVTKEQSQPSNGTEQQRDLIEDLKARGIYLRSPLDSKSDSKSDADADYYQHYPAPISGERLFPLFVIGKNSCNIEKKVGGTSSHSPTVKEYPAIKNTTEQKVTKKKKEKQKIPNPDNALQNVVSDDVSSEQETVSITTKQSQSQYDTKQRKQIQEDIIKIESKELSQPIKQEIKREFHSLKIADGLVRKKNILPSLINKSISQSLPSISQMIQQSTAKINKKKKREETQQQKEIQQNVPYCHIEVSKIEKIFNYVDSADKCLQAIIKKTSTNDQQRNVNNHDKLHYVLQHIQYAHRDLKSIRQSIQQKHKVKVQNLSNKK